MFDFRDENSKKDNFLKFVENKLVYLRFWFKQWFKNIALNESDFKFC